MKHKKNWVIAGLVVAVIGLIGWLVYADSQTAPTAQAPTPKLNTSPVAQDNDPSVINFYGRNLATIDPATLNKTGVTGLILSNNKLAALPAEVAHLTSLTTLVADHNQFEGALPGFIGTLPLKNLDVSYNKMTAIPAEIGQLRQLEVLDYSNNNIETLPNELGNLKQLQMLNLTGNPLTADKVAKIKADLPNTQVNF